MLTLPVPDDSLCTVPSFGAGVYPLADGALLSEGAEVVSGVAGVAGLEVVEGAISPLSCVDTGAVAEIGVTGADVSWFTAGAAALSLVVPLPDSGAEAGVVAAGVVEVGAEAAPLSVGVVGAEAGAEVGADTVVEAGADTG